jgi:hypothetical protein
MSVVPDFWYLCVVFDKKTSTGRTRALHSAEMLQTYKLFAIYGRGAHLDVMLILYRGLIRSALEDGCKAFDRMAATHMLKLKRIQYRCLRIALGLMQSTHVKTQ